METANIYLITKWDGKQETVISDSLQTVISIHPNLKAIELKHKNAEILKPQQPK